MTAAPAIATPKEHPLLMSAPMVKAILEDRKSQTRRIIPRPIFKKNGQRIVPGCDACWAASVPHNGGEAAFGGPCYLRVPACDHVGGDGYPGGGRIWPKWNVGDRLRVAYDRARLITLEVTDVSVERSRDSFVWCISFRRLKP